MSEQKHTPGPWHWVIHDHSCASLGVGEDPGMGTPLVMSVSPCRSCTDRVKDGEWEWGRCTTPSEADARLIAAAPELLEALIMVRDADEDCKADGLPSIPPAARTKIDAAIAKANGVQP